ncbi:MAG: DUF3782 domain-containing protein [Verrucomicrobia bacterium]|nr:DUF3782 domain-containing protein [Verrucomicrobiota bacterium]
MTDTDLKELVASLAVAQKETNRQLEQTDGNLRRLEGLFNNQWGRLVEALVEPACLRLFQEWGIAVNYTMRRVKSGDLASGMEIDVLLVNGTEAVAVEVKTTCRVEDIRNVLEQLDKFKLAFPAFAAHRVYGGIAAINFDEDSDRHAFQQGLFVLKTSGETVAIANTHGFRPRVF